MADMWFKRCPQCGTYMKKVEPQESGMCCACGWEEYVGAFYCEVVDKYCTHLSQDYSLEVASYRPHRMRKFRS
jgi:anaerobic ribonucleoside-triphosphate reductase